MKTFQDRYNLHVDVEAIENYVDGTFRKLNRTTRSLHKPTPHHRKEKWQERDIKHLSSH
ncbi:hypothetical protein FX988_01176 [Paraglaciecola mesophila]|uniref:Uncharacterized protein n=1 Tax=Paraglaciecola mesophila TaxID=197222 RepID=A0A857JJZ2_9ALTE|nr:hypothetical protein [Paraglaciecola mesophila]QHJ10954.1 hypothetical protein FX988_01176 [Paraglaciecola mesophila]